jgi:hypothetical protein
MKSNIDKVYSKLPKTELAKVELGIVQDIQKDIERGLTRGKTMVKYVNDISSKNKELLKTETKYNSLVNALNSDIEGFNVTRSDVVSSYNRASSQYEEIVNKSSDLGVSVPTKVESSYKELDKLYEKQKNSYPSQEVVKRNLI